MLNSRENVSAISRQVFCLPKLSGTTRGSHGTSSLRGFESVTISFGDAEIPYHVTPYSIEAFAQLTLALLIRQYVGIEDQMDIVFGSFRYCKNEMQLERQSISLTESMKVSDGLDQLMSSRVQRHGSLDMYPIQSAVYVHQVHTANSSLDSLMSSSSVRNQIADLKLVVIVEQVSDTLTGRILYDSDEFDQFFAVSLSTAFSIGLRRAVSNISTEIDHITFLAPEHEKQISFWTSGHLESWYCRLDEIFEHTALRKGQDVAVESHDGTFTFEQLDHLSDFLLCELQRFDVKAGDSIGHCFDLGICGIVATLAIFKAGCVLVPLDPAHPPARHSHILHLTRTQILLSNRYPESQGQVLGLIVMSITPCLLQEHLSQVRPIRSRPEILCDNAVICFTSGSSGIPKGILQTHKGLATMVRALGRRLCIDANSRISGLHPYVFDVSVMEIFCTFLAGAVLCIPRKEDMSLSQPQHLGQALAATAVTHTVLTPTMLKTLNPGQVSSIRVIASMGEALDHDLLDRWGSREQFQLLQLWGTTEASILQTCTEPMRSEHNPRCIGKPLSGTCRVWIVDCRDHRRLAPVGAIGELVVEGPALASGYLANGIETQSRFVQSPNWLKHGGIFGAYKTGDLARYDMNGSIVFVGRQDDQVNIHGERVELGEIDYHLLQLCIPDVSDIFTDFIWDSQSIIVFCCLKRTQPQPEMLSITMEDQHRLEVSLRGVREWLSEHLPLHMVPQLYVPISRRPVTATGKTDRKALRNLLSRIAQADLQVFLNLNL